MKRAMILTMLALSLAAPPSLRAAEAEATTSAPAVDLASMSLPDLWRDACLWEVGSNAEKVPAARRELIARGQAALDYIVPGQLDTKDTLITRAHGVVITGIGAKAIEPLRQALRAEQPNVRRNAADLLGQLGDTASATAIAELLKTPETRGGALGALGALKAQDAVGAIANLLAPNAPLPGAARPGPGIGPGSRPGLLERDRVASAATLGNIAGPEAERALVAALGDDAAQVRFAAQMALEKLKASASLVPVVARRTNGHARLHAIAALGNIGVAADAPALLPLLWDEAAVVRGFAAEALGKLARPEDIEAIRAALARETDAFARGKMIAAIGPD